MIEKACLRLLAFKAKVKTNRSFVGNSNNATKARTRQPACGCYPPAINALESCDSKAFTYMIRGKMMSYFMCRFPQPIYKYILPHFKKNSNKKIKKIFIKKNLYIST